MKAVIDGDGVLIDFSDSDDTNGIDVPDDCDLDIGKYVWDGTSFNPIMSKFNENGPAPDFFKAVLKSLVVIRDSGCIKFPNDVLAWMYSEEKTLKSLGKW